MKNTIMILVAALAVTFSSCKKEDNNPPNSETYRIEFFRLDLQWLYQSDVRVEVNGIDLGIIPTTTLSEGHFDAYETNGTPFPIGAGYNVNLTDSYEIKFFDNQNDSLIGTANGTLTLEDDGQYGTYPYFDEGLFMSTPYIDQICTGGVEIYNLGAGYTDGKLYVFLRMEL